jgi:hypothetical protein
MRSVGVLICSLTWLGCAGALQAADRATAPQALDFFESRVRPVLVEHCFTCHGPKRQQAGLRLDSRAALLKGSDNGPVLTLGEPDKSPLIQALRYAGELKMPPKGKLPAAAIEAVTTWIKMGAPWPEVQAAKVGANPETAATGHWAFQPVRSPTQPKVRDTAWVQSPVDAFILAGLEARGLAVAPPTDRRTLLRRVTFDLTGLPPTPDEVAAFEADPSADAYARVVDRLLASPRYGERWGRYWLDVARYADTKGYVFEEERRYPYAYTYRDYVIRAFNEDLPYDRFILQQLAADQLPLGADKQPLAAMGFLTVGRRFLNNVHDIIDDRLDVLTRGTLGLTVSCARCHDHKFDPIPTADYYSLYGVFANSVEPRDLPLLGPPQRTEAYVAFERELQTREQAVTKFQEEHKTELAARNRKFRDQLRALQKKVEQWKVTGPGSPPRAMVLEDKPQPASPRVFLRGNPGNPGPEVPRQFLRVLAGDQRKPFTRGSGRLELAQAIASKDNPLTARVLVNRVWLHHFGAGLVRTPSDFGLRSEPPTHPELLDYLAARFVHDGWSIKNLHRLILLSSAYQQSSDGDPRLLALDPDNRLLGRMNRQRLDFEALRDALLAAAGHLDVRMGGAPVDLLARPFSPRRTVYGFIDRQNLPGMFRTFDFASPDTHNPQRYHTTVPQQALFLMNSPFVQEQARRLLARPEVQAESDPVQRIQALHRLLYGRAASPEEIALAHRFLDTAPSEAGPAGRGFTPWDEYAQVLLLANEFCFVD